MSQPFTVVKSQLEMVDELAAIQRACFPTLAEAERITAAQYAAHISRFSAGQPAVLDSLLARPQG